jgi:hypothetical protein
MPNHDANEPKQSGRQLQRQRPLVPKPKQPGAHTNIAVTIA